MKLWQVVVTSLRSFPITAEVWPGGRDRSRMKQVLLELYLLGERPTVTEMRAAAGAPGRPTTWSREVARLWADRLRTPARAIREYPTWRYPFLIPNEAIGEHGLDSIESRLAAQLTLRVTELGRAIGAGDASVITEKVELLALQHRAIRIWAFTTIALHESADATVPGRLIYPSRRSAG